MKKEVESLIQRATRYLKSAELLLKEGDYESSVSRTYYAMFYAVQAVLLTRDLSFSSHKGVISAFGKHFVQTDIFPREMGRELNRAFEKRQMGDYEYTFVMFASLLPWRPAAISHPSSCTNSTTTSSGSRQ